MNIRDGIKKYLSEGDMLLSDLCILLPQCEGYSKDKHQKMLKDFASSLNFNDCHFEMGETFISFHQSKEDKRLAHDEYVLTINFSPDGSHIIEKIDLTKIESLNLDIIGH